MKFMLMMMAPRGTGDWAVMAWKPEALRAHIDYMKALARDLAASGELVAAEGLAEPAAARIVRAAPSGGGFDVTDGPFAETKEFLAGFWIIDVDAPERAHAIAARASRAPGPDGQPLRIPIELRQVMQAPPA